MTEIITIAGSKLTSDNDGDILLEDENEGYFFIRNDEIPGIIAFLLSIEVKS